MHLKIVQPPAQKMMVHPLYEKRRLIVTQSPKT